MLKEKNLNNLTLFFLSLIPLLSTTFFHNHYITLIEVITIFLILVLTLKIYKNSSKKIKYLLVYYLLCFIYLLLNYFHSKSFTSLVPNNFSYNITSETLTLIKLIIPPTFIYSLYYQQIPKEKYHLIFKIWTYLVATSIIITNLLKISLSTYNESIILKNIFEWNNTNYYQDIASRAFFTYPNQIALLLILLLVWFTKEFVYNKNNNILYIAMLSLSMIMLGTRTSSLGGLLILIVLSVTYPIFTIIKKERINYKFTLLIPIIIFWLLILPISPFSSRSAELNQTIINENTKIEEIIETEDRENNIEETETPILIDYKEYIYNNYNPDYLPKVFFEQYYQMEYDLEFWYEFIKNTQVENMNYRYIEKSIIKRVIEINNNKGDILLGISNTRIQNIVNIERDFLLHYYSFGIVGSLILLLIYPTIFMYFLIIFIKDKDYNSFINLSFIGLVIMIAYLTGNILNSINITIPTTFILSSGLKKAKKGC